MAKLEFEFVGFYDCDRYITVNGKFVKFEKTEKKTYTCNVETIDDKCEVMVYQPHKYTGKHWLLWNLMFFIISLFGLFDIRQRRFLVWDSNIIVTSKEDAKILITRQNFEDGGKLINVETNAQVEELTNVQYYDKDAKKKDSTMKKIKIATTIISFILIVVLVAIL